MQQKIAHRNITIPQAEYRRLQTLAKVDQALLQNIARGIKDILGGKIREI